mmetsp:Transcript_28740/g.60425  ORF Transcript_28740/g.60425 Transcript_28740/m.60425 type:complete len:213 (+) Transcript_28740:155-793(+)
MSAASDAAIRAILRAGNHFETLRLPKPYPDLMEEPVWDVTDDDVNRAFRKRSLCCHPDKSKHADAPHAFELLKKAKACLTHELDRDAYVRSFVREQKTLWQGNWTAAAEVVAAKERVSEMRGNAQQAQAESVIDAMHQRRMKAARAARKRERYTSLRDSVQKDTFSADQQRLLDHSDNEEEIQKKHHRKPVHPAPSSTARSAVTARKRPKFL